MQLLRAKDFEALTSAGMRDRRELFSKLLTILVRNLEGEGNTKVAREGLKPRPWHQDKPELCHAEHGEEHPLSAPASVLKAAASPQLPHASAGITDARDFATWFSNLVAKEKICAQI